MSPSVSSVVAVAAAAGSGWYLLGLSVTVGAVVYPAFARVGIAEWPDFHDAHTRAIVAVVGAGWVVEGVATLGWLVTALARTPVDRAAFGLALLHAVGALATVVLTLAGAVPVHRALDAPGLTVAARSGAVGRLRRVHRVRTTAWALAAASATAGLVLTVRE